MAQIYKFLNFNKFIKLNILRNFDIINLKRFKVYINNY